MITKVQPYSYSVNKNNIYKFHYKDYKKTQTNLNMSDCFVKSKALTFGCSNIQNQNQEYINKFQIGKINLIDKKTNKSFPAVITREMIESYEDCPNQILLRVYAKDKLAGQVYAYDAPMGAGGKISTIGKLFIKNTEYYNRLHQKKPLTALKGECLESYLGNEYRGIGKELVKELINESFKRGHDGHFLFYAKNTIGIYGYRPHSESPVPFYWNAIGMRANNKLNKEILLAMKSFNSQKKEFIKNPNAKKPIYSGPQEAYMFLPPSAREKWKKVLINQIK